ncbi:MAG: MFS transporter [Acidiferrobacterales bacterium]
MQPNVVLTTLAMLAVLTMGSMANFTVAVIAPEAAPDIGVPATYIGLFTSIVYFVAMVSGTLTGTFIFRYGAIRVCQFTMLMAASGMAAITFASPLFAVIAAILLGLAYGPYNPASAHVLVGLSTPRWRPLIFSAKQTGVPLGGALAGAVVPLLILGYGWEGAALIVGVVALVVMMAVQPLRRTFDADRRPNWPLASASMIKPLRLVFTDPMLRRYLMVGFAYSGTQVSIGAFFVVYLAQAVNMSLVEAGVLFAFVQAGGILGRIVWALIAERFISTRTLLVWLGLLTAVSLVVTATVTSAWPRAVIAALGFVLGTSSFGWVGIYLYEIARLAPEGKAGEATGGTQFVSFSGVVIMPPCFGALVNLTGSYTIAFSAISVLMAATCSHLLSSARPKLQPSAERSDGEVDVKREGDSAP